VEYVFMAWCLVKAQGQLHTPAQRPCINVNVNASRRESVTLYIKVKVNWASVNETTNLPPSVFILH